MEFLVIKKAQEETAEYCIQLQREGEKARG